MEFRIDILTVIWCVVATVTITIVIARMYRKFTNKANSLHYCVCENTKFLHEVIGQQSVILTEIQKIIKSKEKPMNLNGINEAYKDAANNKEENKKS